MFKCNCCGTCCRNIGGVKLYEDLDDGTGVCKYFNVSTNLCEIYEKRPLKCRIDDAYKVIFYKYMPLEEYYNINYESCKKLKGSV